MTRPVKRENIKRQFAGQHDGEVVAAVVRRYPIVLRIPMIVGLLIILVGLIPWAIATANEYSWIGLANIWLLLAMIGLAWYWLREWVGWYYSVYVLTDARLMVIAQKGFFKRAVSELAFNNIQNVNYQINGFQASVFGFGDIKIETLSGSGGLQLDHIHHPAQFQQEILSAVHAHSSTQANG